MAYLIIEITIAVLAVFGLYAIARLLAMRLLSPAAVAAVLEIRRPMAEEEVEFLLARARDNFFLRTNARVVALVDRSLRKDTELIAALLNGSATIYFVQLSEQREGE